eukprot:54705-Eustigmatos_ZCMA.PRE.2
MQNGMCVHEDSEGDRCVRVLCSQITCATMSCYVRSSSTQDGIVRLRSTCATAHLTPRDHSNHVVDSREGWNCVHGTVRTRGCEIVRLHPDADREEPKRSRGRHASAPSAMVLVTMTAGNCCGAAAAASALGPVAGQGAW